MLRLSLLWVAGLSLAAAPPTRPKPEAANPFQCAQRLLNRGEYLKAADLLARGKASELNATGPFHQWTDQVTAFITNHAPERPAGDASKADRADLRQISRAQLRDAIPEIVERARRTNIVILNEEHLAPRDRAFALQVARALRPLGYSVLAAEAFTSSADRGERESRARSLRDRGYPRLETGYYVRDPVFAGFVRQSLALGYRPVVYEYVAPKAAPAPSDQVALREQGEADNLMRAVFSKNRTAKVLIYVGYAHAAETRLYGSEWMAARLKRLTGVDPLTIDQTTLSPTGNEASLYAALEERLDRRSVVPMLAGKPLKFGDLGAAVDLQVAHPAARLTYGRPSWLVAMGRKPVPIPRRLLPRTGRVLIQAFLQTESDDAVPIDQLVATAGKAPPPLMLPPGPVRFKVRSGYVPGDCETVHKS
jgi:hypothetical protein